MMNQHSLNSENSIKGHIISKIKSDKTPPVVVKNDMFDNKAFLAIIAEGYTLSNKSFRNNLKQDSYISCRVPVNSPLDRVQKQNSKRLLVSPSISTTDWNSIVPRHHGKKHTYNEQFENVHVTKPFKHAITQNNAKQKSRPNSPGASLKFRTEQATRRVARVIAKGTQELKVRIPGKLRKGHLEVMQPVIDNHNPSIKQCRGIIAETQSYSASPSKTLQRRRQILSTLDRNFHHERPQTGESVHQTSIASDPSPRNDDRQGLLLYNQGTDIYLKIDEKKSNGKITYKNDLNHDRHNIIYDNHDEDKESYDNKNFDNMNKKQAEYHGQLNKCTNYDKISIDNKKIINKSKQIYNSNESFQLNKNTRQLKLSGKPQQSINESNLTKCEIQKKLNDLLTVGLIELENKPNINCSLCNKESVAILCRECLKLNGITGSKVVTGDKMTSIDESKLKKINKMCQQVLAQENITKIVNNDSKLNVSHSNEIGTIPSNEKSINVYYLSADTNEIDVYDILIKNENEAENNSIGKFKDSSNTEFNVNFKAPSGHEYYFSYDQRLDIDSDQYWWSLLHGYSLQSKNENEIYIELDSKSIVQGLLFLLTIQQIESIDKQIDQRQYKRIQLPVWMLNYQQPNSQSVSTEYCVSAFIYVPINIDK